MSSVLVGRVGTLDCSGGKIMIFILVEFKSSFQYSKACCRMVKSIKIFRFEKAIPRWRHWSKRMCHLHKNTRRIWYCHKGPKTNPWGTPLTATELGETFPCLTIFEQLVRYLWSQFAVLHPIPALYRVEMRSGWSTVSKALVRSINNDKQAD